MNRWEADVKAIQALPPKDRAAVLRLRIIVGGFVSVTVTVAGAAAVIAKFVV